MRRQHRDHRFLLTALWALGLMTACGGAATQTAGTTPVELAQRAPEPIDYAPAESLFAAEFDLNQLRSSPYISFINGWIEMLRTAAQSAEGGRDVTPLLTAWRETDGLFVAFGAAPAGGLDTQGTESFDSDSSQFVAVLHGHYATGELEQWMRDFVDDDSDMQPAPVEGHFVMRSNHENVFIAVMDARTLVLGVHTDLDAALAIAAGGEPPHGTIDALRAAMNEPHAGQHTLDLSAIATPALRQYLSRSDHGDSSNAAVMAAMVETLESLTGHVSFEDGIAMSLRIDTTNSLSAVAIAQELNNRINAAASQPGLAMLGLDSAARGTHARVDGTACVVELRLDDEATRSLFERVQGLIQLFSAIGHQSDEASEAQPDTDSSPLRNGEPASQPGQI